MLIPLDIAVTVRDLDKTYAAFCKTASEKALSPKIFGHVAIEPVQALSFFGFVSNVQNLRDLALHAKS